MAVRIGIVSSSTALATEFGEIVCKKVRVFSASIHTSPGGVIAEKEHAIVAESLADFSLIIGIVMSRAVTRASAVDALGIVSFWTLFDARPSRVICEVA